MRDGELVQMATPRELLTHPANEFVETFIGKQRQYSDRLNAVREVMSERVICAAPGTSIIEAVDIMRRQRVSSVFVLDSEGRFAGQITVEAIQRLTCGGNEAIDNYANKNIPTVKPDSSARNAFSTMMQDHIDELPVTDDDGRVIGIVTRRSMVTSLARVVWKGDENE